MIWENDDYQREKNEILNIITKNLSEHHAKNVSLRLAFESIDELFEKLKNSKRPFADN